VAAAVLEFLQGDLLAAPRRVGHELRRELAGTWSARRGSYRVLYEISDDPVPGEPEPGRSPAGDERSALGTVLVVDIDHRSDVYRRR
jgi:mRNA-degrading endonuclease RelE of RelBE toxin-antitoxin system